MSSYAKNNATSLINELNHYFQKGYIDKDLFPEIENRLRKLERIESTTNSEAMELFKNIKFNIQGIECNDNSDDISQSFALQGLNDLETYIQTTEQELTEYIKRGIKIVNEDIITYKDSKGRIIKLCDSVVDTEYLLTKTEQELAEIKKIVKRTYPHDVVEGMKQLKALCEV